MVSKAKEPGAIPFRAGDQLRDGRQTRVGFFLPKESVSDHSDRVPRPFVLADEDGAGLQTPVQFAGPVAPGQPVQEFDCFSVEAAKGFLLNPISNHAPKDVFGQTPWRDGAEHQAPTLSQRVDAE